MREKVQDLQEQKTKLELESRRTEGELAHLRDRIGSLENYLRYPKYPKWFVLFLCWFIPGKKNRRRMREKYMRGPKK